MTTIVSDLDPSEQEWKPRRVEKLGASVFDLDIRDVEAYQDEPLTWNTVVADCSSYDSATTENDGEVDMQGKRRSACCLHSNLSDADWIADAKVLLLNWSATTLWLLSSFAGTFLRCRWWITSVDDHVGHNNVVPERIPVPSRTTIPQDATKSGSGQRPGSDTDSYESGGAPCPVCLWMMHSDCQRRFVSASDWLLGVCAYPRVLWHFILIICWHLHRASYDMDRTLFQHQ